MMPPNTKSLSLRQALARDSLQLPSLYSIFGFLAHVRPNQVKKPRHNPACILSTLWIEWFVAIRPSNRSAGGFNGCVLTVLLCLHGFSASDGPQKTSVVRESSCTSERVQRSAFPSREGGVLASDKLKREIRMPPNATRTPSTSAQWH